MCGIAGIVALAPGAAPVDPEELLTIRDAMAARGPDGSGLWIAEDRRLGLGHRRLAVIDPSARADQPMHLRERELVIVFNGEITNYKALRAELAGSGRSFRTQSDTEVLLHLYDRDGPAMVERLRGMFAFAIWDARRRRLFAARDPFGILPFYYAEDRQAGTLRFASQVKALRRSRAIPSKIDPAAQVGFLLLGYVPEPHTTEIAIRALSAGATLTVDGDGVAERVYCDIAAELRCPGESPPAGARPAQLREAVADAVAHSLVADVPVAIFLSGGVDSNAIASFAHATGHRPAGVTIGFSEFRGGPLDETGAAAAAARAFGIAHTVRWVDSGDFTAERPRLLRSMDLPSIDGVNSYFAAKSAREAGFKVALSGIGGDELFCGYPSFRQIPALVGLIDGAPGLARAGTGLRALTAPMFRRLGKPKWAGLIEYGGGVAEAYLLRRALFMPWELPSLLDPDLVRAGWQSLQPLERLRATAAGMPSAASAIAALELCWYMRSQLLRDADWAGLAHGLEIRPPLLDLPLLRAMAPLLASTAPPAKADLLASLDPPPPPEVLTRPKMGFAIPWRDWIERAPSRQYPARIWAHDVLHALSA